MLVRLHEARLAHSLANTAACQGHPNPLVIIGTKTGQLANRLFAFAYFIGNSIEFGYPLLNPTFLEYRRYFKATRDNDFHGYPISVSELDTTLLYKALRHSIGRLLPSSPWHEIVIAKHHEFDLNTISFKETTSQKPLVICYGWLCRDYENMRKHGDVIRQVFTPLKVHREAISDVITACREDSDVVVGVHIRRGDYEQWRGGAFFFDHTIYREKMQQLARHPSLVGKRVHFLLVSNEAFDPDFFSPCSCSCGSGHLIEDLFGLAACDFIIGPPSTFSAWASFYGRVRLMHINSADQDLSFGEFEIVAT